MKPAFSYAVIGTGAVGGYYGSLLQRSGKQVHFLLHSDYEQVKRHGLTIASKNGDFILPHVNAYGNPRDLPRCDVAIVALKATANDILPAILPAVLNDRGIVLLLQNGYGQEEFIAAIDGVKTIVAGLCFICVSKTAPGTICHQDYGAAILAQFAKDNSTAGITVVMERLAAGLTDAGVAVTLNPDLIEARWRKLVWNIPFSGLTTLFQLDTARVVNSPTLLRLARDLMKEVVEGALALDRVIPESFIDKMVRDTEQMRPYFPSMKLDFDARKPLELEAMYKEPLEAAYRRGKSLARIAMLYEELSFLQEIEISPLVKGK
ncbi:MAG: putative 2-dehydropantoate 2-reductase [Syntrophales bacterium LBB04]|nr:putative 2-dehydropantoate 2-reductase [Syntrophales bacterium LBB04]